MGKSLQAVRGMSDVLPNQTANFLQVEADLKLLALIYGYREIRLPIIESTALYERTIGETSDIVSKEMYTFEDRNGDWLTLRPEGTAGCLRAGIEHGLFYGQIQKLWYLGPMFRHERPQKGRYRQFTQFGMEVVGTSLPTADVELIAVGARLWKWLNLSDQVRLEINTLGTPAVRESHKKALIQYITPFRDLLDEENLVRLEKNPLRILDSKQDNLQAVIANAPSLQDFLDPESQSHFEKICQGLEALGIAYHINPTLVRGLDYYQHTVFEWITDLLGAQGTLCAGGRFDGLVAELGGEPTPAVGFAMGLERVIALMQNKTDPDPQSPDVFVIVLDQSAATYANTLCEHLRDAIPTLFIANGFYESSAKSQFKRADKSGALWALVIGQSEMESNGVTVKSLREMNGQITLNKVDLIDYFMEQIKEQMNE